MDWIDGCRAGIAMVESTGGIHYANRNVFGWGNGRIKFRLVQGSIYYVASRLSRSRPYSGKAVVAVLRTYNSVRPEYPERVMRFMRRLPADYVKRTELCRDTAVGGATTGRHPRGLLSWRPLKRGAHRLFRAAARCRWERPCARPKNFSSAQSKSHRDILRDSIHVVLDPGVRIAASAVCMNLVSAAK